MRPIVLASASPRRRDLLALLGMPFVVWPAQVDEIRRPGESPDTLVARLSATKAAAARSHVQIVVRETSDARARISRIEHDAQRVRARC